MKRNKKLDDIMLDSLRLGNERSIAAFGEVEVDGKKVQSIEQYVREGDGVCDFCSTRAATLREHPCKTFEIATHVPGIGRILTEMQGAWMACPDCDALVRADKWSALLLRSLRLASERIGATLPPQTAIELRRLHAAFRANRC